MNRILLLFILFVNANADADADQVDCVEFPIGDIISFEIIPEAEFFNCFKLVSMPAQTDLMVTVTADEDVTNEVSFYDTGPLAPGD